MIKFTPTERGFSYGEFQDRYGQRCSLQGSSLATEAAIWYGVEIDLNGIPVSQRMHLTIPMIREHLPALLNFVYTGELMGQDANDPLAVIANLLGETVKEEEEIVKIQEKIAAQLTSEGAAFLTQLIGQYHATH